MYCLEIHLDNAAENVALGKKFAHSPQEVRKWTLLPPTPDNIEMLRLIGLAYGGIHWLESLDIVGENGVRGWESYFHDADRPLRIEVVTAGHRPYDWNARDNIRGSGLMFHLNSETRFEKIKSNEFRYLPESLPKKQLALGSTGNQSTFFLGFGPRPLPLSGKDDFEFNNPLFRQTRFHSLFHPAKPLTNPVCFLQNLHYKGVLRGREPRKNALQLLTRELARHLGFPTSDWLHKTCDFEEVWQQMPGNLQTMVLPILDVTRHLFDAFPKVFEPMKMPGLVLIDRPDQYCSTLLHDWMNLVDLLFPNLQFICVLEPEGLETLEPVLGSKNLPVPEPLAEKKSTDKPVLTRNSVLLLDVDSTIPNLALMKLARFHKARGKKVVLARGEYYCSRPGEVYASTVFFKPASSRKLAGLSRFYGDRLVTGGSGIDLQKRLPSEIENLMPDFELYPSLEDKALGFLTRGCPLKCPFCIVPVKDGKTRVVNDLDNLLQNRKKLILLDDNILSHPLANSFLEEMAKKKIRVNFTQTFDLRMVNKERVGLIKRVACSNLDFDRNVFHFSLNDARHLKKVSEKYRLFDFKPHDNVEFVCMYGFDTTLAEDVERFRFLRSLPGAYVFVQEYLPIRGGPPPILDHFFDDHADQLIDELIRVIFKQNMKSMEKYYRWLSRFYARTFGKLHMNLVDTIFRYNQRDKKGIYIQTLAGTRPKRGGNR